MSRYDFDFLLLLQPTNPFRNIKLLKEIISNLQTYKSQQVEIITTGSIFKESLWEKNNNQYVKTWDDGRIQQNRKHRLIEDGSFYFIDVKSYLTKKCLDKMSWFFFENDWPHNIDINNALDLEIARWVGETKYPNFF